MTEKIFTDEMIKRISDRVTKTRHELPMHTCINPECNKQVNTCYNLKCEECWRKNMHHESHFGIPNKQGEREWVHIKVNNTNVAWFNLIEINDCILIARESE